MIEFEAKDYVAIGLIVFYSFFLVWLIIYGWDYIPR